MNAGLSRRGRRARKQAGKAAMRRALWQVPHWRRCFAYQLTCAKFFREIGKVSTGLDFTRRAALMRPKLERLP